MQHPNTASPLGNAASADYRHQTGSDDTGVDAGHNQDHHRGKAARDEWLFAPDIPIGNNPLFEWPLNARRILTYYRDYWLTVSEVSIFFVLAVAGWFALRGVLEGAAVLSAGWVLAVWALNLAVVLVFAGGFHLFFYQLRAQGTDLKYVPQFGHRGGARFTFGSQVRDNMFWSLASGVSVWTGYLVFLLWAHAQGWTPAITVTAQPVTFFVVALFTGPWIAFHFYWGHRLLHVGPLYRHVHSLHHRNVNIGPWSGISMHPVEHVIYFSSMLIHLVVPSHPVLIMFHGYMLSLSAIFGHTGFHEMMIGNRARVAVGHFHHQLHHRYFECNYGSVDFPLDVWFGTFHDGTPEARRRLKSRLRPRWQR